MAVIVGGGELAYRYLHAEGVERLVVAEVIQQAAELQQKRRDNEIKAQAVEIARQVGKLLGG